MRAAIYARYSTDRQNPRSLDDQIAVCRQRAEADGHQITDIYTDAAISGANAVNRPGLAALMAAAAAGQIDLVIAEALDRLSRSQRDTADIFERLEFAGVKLVTLSEGTVDELHVGFKGTINAVFLRELKQKIRRGMTGLVASGKSAGGLSFGYRVVRKLDAEGNLVRGLREIIPEQADIIRRIFREYGEGRTARDIATRLNRDSIAPPRGARWNASTINGNRARRSGILYNEAYIGFLVWNRTTMIKDPDTGRRIHRLNPPDQWQVTEMPDWRILSDDDWQAAHAIKDQYSNSGDNRKKPARRPRRLLSGILKCGKCGASWTAKSASQSACSRARESGDCDNTKTISFDRIEKRVFSGLQRELMNPERVRRKIAEIRTDILRQRKQARRDESKMKQELATVQQSITALIDAIEAGMLDDDLKRRFKEQTTRRDQLKAELASLTEKPQVVELLPNLADIYEQKIAGLTDALKSDEDRARAIQALRMIFTRIEVHPLKGRGEFNLEITTSLPELLGMEQTKNQRGFAVVAEEGFEPPTRGL